MGCCQAAPSLKHQSYELVDAESKTSRSKNAGRISKDGSQESQNVAARKGPDLDGYDTVLSIPPAPTPAGHGEHQGLLAGTRGRATGSSDVLPVQSVENTQAYVASTAKVHERLHAPANRSPMPSVSGAVGNGDDPPLLPSAPAAKAKKLDMERLLDMQRHGELDWRSTPPDPLDTVHLNFHPDASGGGKSTVENRYPDSTVLKTFGDGPRPKAKAKSRAGDAGLVVSRRRVPVTVITDDFPDNEDDQQASLVEDERIQLADLDTDMKLSAIRGFGGR